MNVYWMVFAAFYLIDYFDESIMRFFPVYYLLKVIFLIWLQLRSTYRDFLKPKLMQLGKKGRFDE